MGQDTFTVCGVHITFGWLRSRKKGLSVPTATVTWLLPLVNSGRTSKSDLYPQWIFFVSRKKTHNQYIPLENLQPKVKWRSAMLQTFQNFFLPEYLYLRWLSHLTSIVNFFMRIRDSLNPGHTIHTLPEPALRRDISLNKCKASVLFFLAPWIRGSKNRESSPCLKEKAEPS